MLEQLLDVRAGKSLAARRTEGDLQLKPVLPGALHVDPGTHPLDVACHVGKPRAERNLPFPLEFLIFPRKKCQDLPLAAELELAVGIRAGETPARQSRQRSLLGSDVAREQLRRAGGVGEQEIFRVGRDSHRQHANAVSRLQPGREMVQGAFQHQGKIRSGGFDGRAGRSFPLASHLKKLLQRRQFDCEELRGFFRRELNLTLEQRMIRGRQPRGDFLKFRIPHQPGMRPCDQQASI